MHQYFHNRTSASFNLLLLLVGLFVSGCKQPSEQAAPAPPSMPPPQVTVANPLVSEVTDWDEFTGRLYAVKSVDVQARVNGYLQSINFKEGDIVNKGDLLYVIDPRPYQAVLDQAKAELSRSRANLELADNDLSRAQRLFQSRAISEEELDSRSKQKQASLAALAAAKAAVESAELNVEFTHIKSPISGRISRTLVTEGNLISGGTKDSTLLTTIVSLDPIYVYFTADEQSVLHYTRMDMAGTRKSSRVAPKPVYLRLADEADYMHKGHMDFVDNQIDMDTGTMRARAIVENPDYLLVPGMFADVKLLGEGPYEAILIPDAAIITDQTVKFVYVLGENNIVERRQVTAGSLHGDLRVIRSGLDRNDSVIIDGIQRVRAGSPVTPETGSIKAPVEEQG